MADNRVVVKYDFQTVQAQKNVKDLGRTTEKFEKDTTNSTKKMGSSYANLATKVLAIVAAVGLLVAGFAKLNRVYSEQIAAETKRAQVLVSTKNAIGTNIKELDAWAESLSDATGITDEAIITAQGLGLTFTKIGKEVFPEVIERAADMSKMFGQSMQQSMIQLGTAINDPIKGVGRLMRIGISFTEEQKNMIKQLVAVNDIMGAQRIILDELNVEFGGVARAMGEALGPLARIEQKFTDFQQSLFAVFDPFARIVGEKVVSGLEQITTWFEDNRETIIKFFIQLPKIAQVTFKTVQKYIQQLFTLKGISNFFKNLGSYVSTVMQEVVNIIFIIVTTGIEIVSERILSIFQNLWYYLQAGFRSVIEMLVSDAQQFPNIFNFIFGNLLKVLNKIIEAGAWIQKNIFGIDQEIIKIEFPKMEIEEQIMQWDELVKPENVVEAENKISKLWTGMFERIGEAGLNIAKASTENIAIQMAEDLANNIVAEVNAILAEDIEIPTGGKEAVPAEPVPLSETEKYLMLLQDALKEWDNINVELLKTGGTHSEFVKSLAESLKLQEEFKNINLTITRLKSLQSEFSEDQEKFDNGTLVIANEINEQIFKQLQLLELSKDMKNDGIKPLEENLALINEINKKENDRISIIRNQLNDLNNLMNFLKKEAEYDFTVDMPISDFAMTRFGIDISGLENAIKMLQDEINKIEAEPLTKAWENILSIQEKMIDPLEKQKQEIQNQIGLTEDFLKMLGISEAQAKTAESIIQGLRAELAKLEGAPLEKLTEEVLKIEDRFKNASELKIEQLDKEIAITKELLSTLEATDPLFSRVSNILTNLETEYTSLQSTTEEIIQKTEETQGFISRMIGTLKDKLGTIIDDFLGIDRGKIAEQKGVSVDALGAGDIVIGWVLGALQRLGESIEQVIEWYAGLIMSTESMQLAQTQFKDNLLNAVNPAGKELAIALWPLSIIAVEIVKIFSANLIPIIKFFAKAIIQLSPVIIKLAEGFFSMLKPLFMIAEPLIFFATILATGILPVFSGLFTVIGGLWSIIGGVLTPVFIALGFVMKVVLTPLTLFGGYLEWIGNIMLGVGEAIMLFFTGQWGKFSEIDWGESLGDILASNLSNLWDTEEMTDALADNAMPDLDLDSLNIDNLENLDTPGLDDQLSISGGEARVTPVNITIIINAGNIITTNEGLQELLVESLESYVQRGGTIQLQQA
jgi:hypothetical protein